MTDQAVQITNADKLLWPDDGLTKQDLADHYDRFAALMLDELEGRLLTLVRAPNGVDEDTFFQKNAPKYTPDWIRTVTIPAPSAKRDVSFLVCESPAALRWIANQAGVELHVCLDRDSKPGRPDVIVFDMDPPEGRFDMAVEGAMLIKKILEGTGLQPGVKTTGGKGLHVYLRIERRYSFKQTHEFAVKVAERAIEKAPSLVTMEFKKADREGRVFLDVHRNGPGATVIAPFSPRARAGATISFPITWRQATTVDPADFNMRSVPRMLKSKAVGDWREELKHKQRLPKA